MVVIRDPVLALDFDLAATAQLLEAERRAITGEGWGGGAISPPGAGAREINW
ncbi:MAG TPA: hypothetical protein VG028_04110 [Terriglobia bacterium]|nr:hypothetical protein [Terriglobia bacterium]